MIQWYDTIINKDCCAGALAPDRKWMYLEQLNQLWLLLFCCRLLPTRQAWRGGSSVCRYVTAVYSSMCLRQEFIIPSLAHRFIAEMVDFFILFFIKATIVLSIMHLSGIKDISKFAMHYIIEEIDEDTSMEDLQKMMIVALIYRLLVCFYEIICIWGAGGATPGKFLLGLRVVTCDTSVLIAPSRVLVIPSSNVSMTTSTIRALIKNFSIASFFPAFITLLFFQHNRTAYDIVAGTIVVRRNGVR
ncbi:PREDICTED: protein FAM8A1 [Chlamydotis macqueenii]|uniref:protein FAM8A1 n=1 Tax=Chlamydotis macqueenii TaxID=187382 RepID=UPI000529B116|nr:PREDICTED: protein FAM8A1 [Chlamydotis macqueenii]